MKMKEMRIIAAVFLMALIGASCQLNAQRGQRGFMRDSLMKARTDTAFSDRMRMQRFPMNERYRSYGNRDMSNFQYRRGYSYYGHMDRRPGYYRQAPAGRDFYHMPFYPNRRRADSAFMDRPGRLYQGRQGYIPENIPGITGDQKEKIRELMEKNRSEMSKFRDETAAAMRKMREQHKEKLFGILTPEQKKWLESVGSDKLVSPPEKQ
jgi:Spy/CpxP family protein refolding chaperone